MSLQVTDEHYHYWAAPPSASGKFASCEKKTYKTLDMLTLVQSLQSKEKKEKSERKITALLMGKLQVNQNHFKCPVVCLTFLAHTDKELKGQPCVNWILFCSGRYALPGQAGSSPSVAGDSKISDIWGAGYLGYQICKIADISDIRYLEYHASLDIGYLGYLTVSLNSLIYNRKVLSVCLSVCHEKWSLCPTVSNQVL